MRTDEFVLRGKTEDFKTTAAHEVLNFSGFKPGLAYKLTEFSLFPSEGLHLLDLELSGCITVGKTPLDPSVPDFNDESLIATTIFNVGNVNQDPVNQISVINDTYLITQNLILTVADTGTNAKPVNWQCRFEPVKMSKAEEAVANYKQFMISDGS